jgi:hypothetical protein
MFPRRVATGVTDVDTKTVRSFLVATHADVVETVRDCAAASATTGTDATGRSDTSVVRRGIETELRDAGVWDRLPTVLVDCVEVVGGRLRATPVAAPPYVAPTATGVVLRGTLERGRLVVAVDALAVERGDEGGATPERAGERTTGVTLRPRPPDTPLAELIRIEWRE